jgi:hypothetical protein
MYACVEEWGERMGDRLLRRSSFGPPVRDGRMRAMGDNEILDPPDDPDFISEEGTDATWGDAPPLRTRGSGSTVFVPKTSTPLQEDATDSSIPAFALWSMKYLRHGHLFGRAQTEIRQSIGEGDHVIYVLDDGRNHCLVSRKVGTSPDGCTYCLVARIPIATYDALVAGATADSAFAEGRSFSLCAVFEAQDGVSNVAVSERYDAVDEVPAEYLPPNPPIWFAELPEE